MEEVVLTQQEFTALTKKTEAYNDYSNKILRVLKTATNNFVEIGFYLNEVKSKELYTIEGYSDIYDYSSNVFGLSKTTTSNFIGIFNKFGISNDLGYFRTFELKKEYDGFNLSKLIELLPVKDEDLEKYKPEMTVSEIRAVKAQEKIDSTVKTIMDANCEEFMNYFIEKLNSRMVKIVKINV